MPVVVDDPGRSLFQGRGLFTAWGAGAAPSARDAGFDWIALQKSATLWHALPLQGTAGDGWIVQIEGPNQYQAALELLPTLEGECAVVTNFGGCDNRELVDALPVSTCLVECYAPEDPTHADIPRMLWQAGQYSWPIAVPVLGLYHDTGLDAYPLLDRSGPFAVWLAEELRPQDWQDLSTFNSLKGGGG